MSTAIVYYSKHHGNTKKLIDAIKADDPDIKLIDVTVNKIADLDSYDRIGIASGIYYGKFNKGLMEYLENKLPHCKKVFALYTYGSESDKYTNSIKTMAKERSCKYLGEYGCFGFDTFGPFKLVGGLKKGHPTEDEIAGAVRFYQTLV